jgi:hypothetical protein
MPGKLDCFERDASRGARGGHELGATRALLRYWSATQPGSAARPVGAGWPLSVAAPTRRNAHRPDGFHVVLVAHRQGHHSPVA